MSGQAAILTGPLPARPNHVRVQAIRPARPCAGVRRSGDLLSPRERGKGRGSARFSGLSNAAMCLRPLPRKAGEGQGGGSLP
jgi:hypothetical protein